MCGPLRGQSGRDVSTRALTGAYERTPRTDLYPRSVLGTREPWLARTPRSRAGLPRRGRTDYRPTEPLRGQSRRDVSTRALTGAYGTDRPGRIYAPEAPRQDTQDLGQRPRVPPVHRLRGTKGLHRRGRADPTGPLRGHAGRDVSTRARWAGPPARGTPHATCRGGGEASRTPPLSSRSPVARAPPSRRAHATVRGAGPVTAQEGRDPSGLPVFPSLRHRVRQVAWPGMPRTRLCPRGAGPPHTLLTDARTQNPTRPGRAPEGLPTRCGLEGTF